MWYSNEPIDEKWKLPQFSSQQQNSMSRTSMVIAYTHNIEHRTMMMSFSAFQIDIEPLKSLQIFLSLQPRCLSYSLSPPSSKKNASQFVSSYWINCNTMGQREWPPAISITEYIFFSLLSNLNSSVPPVRFYFRSFFCLMFGPKTMSFSFARSTLWAWCGSWTLKHELICTVSFFKCVESSFEEIK